MESFRATATPEKIAFIGSYPPRKCGIATFTHDLVESIAQQVNDSRQVFVVAMTDREGRYRYPPRVKLEVRQDRLDDYARAADFLNDGGAHLVSLQHEYGIFGGESGSNLLTLIRSLRVPLVVTCHTVLRHPDSLQRRVLCEIIERAEQVVVMSRRAGRFIEEIYGADLGKVELIPHGVHPYPFVDPGSFKRRFGLQGRKVIMTFGMLHRYKGIEFMIRALPRIIRRYPDSTYVVLGQTHPAVARREGESYRHQLMDLTRALGVENNVRFDARFTEVDELLEYIGSADVFVTPYITQEYIASGALSYAMAMGKAIVSTPYWYAEELLAGGRGRLVPPRDADALADQVMELLKDERGTIAMRREAHAFARAMSWPIVASSHLKLYERLLRKPGRSRAVTGWAGVSGPHRGRSASRPGLGVEGRRDNH